MKKLISLLLAALLLLGVASADFTDQDQINADYTEFVVAMNEMGIIAGFSDGSFQPKGTLTRAQAAKIICTMLGADAASAKAAGFTDVPAGHWAETFVNFCAEKNIVAGLGGGKFDPNGKLTGFAFAKMLLVAYGADGKELTGAKWAENTEKMLTEGGKADGVAVTAKEITREQACRLAYNFIAAVPTDYVEFSVDMVKETNLYKSYGRMFAGEKGLSIPWPGSGVEFEVECAGDVSITYSAEERGDFQCYVDGEHALRPRTATGKRTTVVAENLAPGKHNIRIIRDHDASSTGLKFELISVNFVGKKETLKAPADKDLLIEFIGDSITSGKGALVQYLEPDQIYGDGSHSGTASYAYLTAQKMNADWHMLSRGSMGYSRTSTSCPKTIEQLYPYYNGLMKDPIPYTPTRQADVAVLALCTNDSEATVKEAGENGTTSYKDMEGAVKWLIEAVRKNNGKDVKIVLIYNMMTSNKAWVPTFEAIAAADPNVFVLKTTRNNDGGRSKVTSTGHPSAAGHEVVANELTAFLKDTVLK